MKAFNDVVIDLNDAASASYDRNRLCMDDYEFAVVEGAMWKGSYADQFANKPKPEINKIFGPINRILGQKERLEMNAIIVPNSETATDDDANLLQSRWRNDFQSSDGAEAQNNADKEAFFSGFGAMKLVAEYDDEEDPDNNMQSICVKPIMGAAGSIVFGPSLRKDKADCKQAWELIRTSRKDVEAEYGPISPVGSNMAWFDFNTDNQKDIFLAKYYEVVTKKVTEYDFGGYRVTSGDGIKDESGIPMTRADLDALKESNEYTKKRRTIKRVEYALMCGDRFLEEGKTPFKRVPIIPQYGYYSVINGIEYYCGEVRKRRDPQMFLNTYYSSLMEILAAPQVSKPEYTPEQIAAHQASRKSADIDGAAFVMSDPVKNPDGTIAHLGPIGSQQPPQIGTGMAAAGAQLDSVLLDMAGTGTSTVPSNAAADAIQQVNERQDDVFQPLIQNSMFANRALCETWIDGAKVTYFSNPRKIRTVSQSGEYSHSETLEYAMDGEGNYGPYKNAARGKYTVQVKVGETYQSKKEAELDTTLKMLNYADTNTPQGQMLLNQAIASTTGEGGQRSRKVASFQMIDSLLELGIDPQPETEEEKEYVERKMQEMQSESQNQQQDPMMIAAMAEMKKAEAEMLAQENKRIELQIQAQRVTVDVEGKERKLQADTALSLATIDQNQQKIDLETASRAAKNAIELTKIEQANAKELNAAYQSNVASVQRSI